MYRKNSNKDCCTMVPYFNIYFRLFHLTNRFHVTVCLLSIRSQMTSKCGKKKKWHTRRNRVCHWCSYHILTSFVIYHWIRRTLTWNLSVLYNNEKPFLFQMFQNNVKAGLLPRLWTKKSHLTWSMISSKWSNFIGSYA